MSKVQSNTGEQIPGLKYAPKKTPAEMMQKFDILPSAVRRAIAECPYRFNVDVALKFCLKGKTAAQIAAFINDAGKDAVRLAEDSRALNEEW